MFQSRDRQKRRRPTIKALIHFLFAVYLGAALLSLYTYLLDILLKRGHAVHHPEWLVQYLVYFIMEQTWTIDWHY